MKLTVSRPKSVAAVSLVELIVAMVILTIVALGALCYPYYAARDARIAHAQITGTKTAQLLLEDWKSTAGSVGYDPTTLGLGFSSPLALPGDPNQLPGPPIGAPLPNGLCDITVDNVPMLVLLRWADIAQDGDAMVTLRQLVIIIAWQESSNVPSAPIVLNTYVRLDASGG